jgi:hypothetical protein
MRQEDDLHDAVLKDVAGFAVTTTTAGAIMGSGKVKVHCPIGKIALGGGFYTKLPPHHLNHTTLESGPSKSHSWICESKGYQQEAGSELSCYVQCGVTKWAKGSKHASSLHVKFKGLRTVVRHHFIGGVLLVNCPSGTTVIGGGMRHHHRCVHCNVFDAKFPVTTPPPTPFPSHLLAPAAFRNKQVVRALRGGVDAGEERLALQLRRRNLLLRALRAATVLRV